MQPIAWTTEYEIGLDEVDSQHRSIIDKINALSGKSGQEVGDSAALRLLEELSDYVRHHFKTEEALMVRGGCDHDFEVRHRSEHAYYRGVLRDFMNDYIDGRSRITSSFLEYLVHWLLHHIVSTDREMVVHLQAVHPDHPERVSARSMQTIASELSAAERQLLFELHHANAQLEERVGGYEKEVAELRAQLADAHQRIDAVLAERGK
jgi:hemerythrin